MNRGLTGVIDAGNHTQALATIYNASGYVGSLMTANESCASYLRFGCDASDNVTTTTRRVDEYMKNALFRLQGLLFGSRSGLSLLRTLIRIVKTTPLTQAERNDYSNTAGNFTEAANATDLARSTHGDDIAELLAALIEKNVEAAEAESAPISSAACAAVTKAYGRVEQLLHKAGTVLTVGGGARRIDTSAFESWSSRVDALGRGRIEPSGAKLNLPQFSYQANSRATAGDVVVMVSVRWKPLVDVCRKTSDMVLESDVHSVTAYGDASRMGDDVYFAAGESMDMTFDARTSSRIAQQAPGCYEPMQCRWWNGTAQAWDPSGCRYNPATASCNCTHLTDFAVVSPKITCPPPPPITFAQRVASVMYPLIAVGVVLVAAMVYFIVQRIRKYRRNKVIKEARDAEKKNMTLHHHTVAPASDEQMSQSELGESKLAWEDADVGETPTANRRDMTMFDLAPRQTTPRKMVRADAKVAAPLNDDAEYMRRCKVKFMTLSRDYDMSVAMEKYDDFLCRPRAEVLADPGSCYVEPKNSPIQSEASESKSMMPSTSTANPSAVSPTIGAGSSALFQTIGLPGAVQSFHIETQKTMFSAQAAADGVVNFDSDDTTSSSDASDVPSTAVRQLVEEMQQEGYESGGSEVENGEAANNNIRDPQL